MIRFIGMHMVHSIVNGNSPSPVNLNPGDSDDEGEERLKHRKLGSVSPQITSKGKMDQDSKDSLIKKIMEENAKLAEQLGNKKAE
jgi:hypothetical protein